MWWWLAAWAGDGFVEARTADDCTVSIRERTETEISAMKAVCIWSDVDPVALGEVLSDFDRYEDQIWVIDESEVREVRGGQSLVYQLQKMWGMSDREVLLWVRSETLPDGVRHRWTTATEEPLALQKGAVRTPTNEGFWEIRANPEGPGALVTHQIAVDAGGIPLPKWLLDWVRTRGFGRVMRDVRAKNRQDSAK